MVAYNKFDIFVEDLMNKVHQLFGTEDLIEVYLSNAAPATTNTLKANIAEITNENGYPNPVGVTPNSSRSTGTYTLGATDVVITASGGTIGPFRYVILFNNTPTTPLDPLIAWWDRGAGLTLQDGESFTIDFQSDQIFTLVQGCEMLETADVETKLCCQNPQNLTDPAPTGVEGEVVRVCNTCGCRHFTAQLDTGHLGLAGQLNNYEGVY